MSQRVPAALRRLVQARAHCRCEYCMIHEEDVHFPHQPDHVIAQKHRGPTHEDNLAWACYLCNLLKGSDIASVDMETGQIVPLFNPRVDGIVRRYVGPCSGLGVSRFEFRLGRGDKPPGGTEQSCLS